MMAKNERLKQQNIDKIAIFLSKKYNKVFKDKEFTMDILKFEIKKLLNGKDMRTFNFNDNIRKIEKSILKKVTNYGQIKCEPIQMAKINNLLSYNKPQVQQQYQIQQNFESNNNRIKAPKSAGNRINIQNSQKRVQSALNQNPNLDVNNNKNINGNNKK